MSNQKGDRRERELVNKLDAAGFAVMRAPASGSATLRELPDILAGNGEVFYAVEVSEKHGKPSVYEAPVIFTESGEYIVHIEGSIEETEFHIHFEIEVEDHTELLYPSNESKTDLEQLK